MGAADQLTAQAPAHHGWLIANLVLQLAFGLLAMTICLPSMQEWPAQFGASQAAVQLTFSAFVATYGAMQLVYGSLSDRIGPQAGAAGRPAAGDRRVGGRRRSRGPRDAHRPRARAAGRGLRRRHGDRAGDGAGPVHRRRAHPRDGADRHEHGRVPAAGHACWAARCTCAWAGRRTSWRWRRWARCCCWPPGSACRRAGPPTRPRPPRNPLAGYLRLAREPSFWLYVGLLATLTATFYSFLAGLPLVLAAYGVTPATLGWYIGVVPLAYIGGNYLTTRLARTHSDRFIMGWGQAATVAGLLLVLVLALAGVRSPLAVVLPLLLLGVGHGLVVPPTLTGTVGVVPALAGSAAAVGGVSQQVLGAVGALSSAWCRTRALSTWRC
jgi:DHA1 family bicyclomycin/chloramphenicol resistance-like MFS transporter